MVWMTLTADTARAAVVVAAAWEAVVHVGACCDGERGCGVAEVVRVRPSRSSRVGEEEQFVLVAAAGHSLELGTEELRDGDGAAFAGLGRSFVLDAVDVVEGAGDADAAAGQVDAADAECGASPQRI